MLKEAFVLSGIAATALLSLRGSLWQRGAGLVCSLAVLLVIAFRFGFIQKALSGLTKWTVSFAGILSPLAAYRLAIDFNRIYNRRALAVLLAGAALIALFFFMHWFVSRAFTFAKEFSIRMDRAERLFLAVCIPLFCIAVALTFSVTDAFYSPKPAGYAVYDVVYTTDSSVLMDTNTYQSVNAKENDIRHPLFGVFAMPFGLLAGVIARLLFFLPNAYPIMIGMVQTIPLLCGLLMLARLMRLTGAVKVGFFLLSAASFPALLYTLTMERYVFTFFWLVLLIYLSAEKKGGRELAYIAATGATLTTGVLFPLLTGGGGFQKRVLVIARCALKFFAVVAVFGQLPLFLNAVDSLQGLTRFTGAGVAFSDRLLQYIQFIASCFTMPPSGLDTTTYGYPTWQAEPAVSVSILGLLLLFAAAAGFILNRKSLFAQICAGWAAFSFLILCVVGWGTAENGLVLYTLYFSWAFLSLIVLLIEKLFARWKPLRVSLYATAMAAMLTINLPGMAELIRFGIETYPVR